LIAWDIEVMPDSGFSDDFALSIRDTVPATIGELNDVPKRCRRSPQGQVLTMFLSRACNQDVSLRP